MGKLVIGVNDLKTWCLQNGQHGQRLIDEWVGLDENGNKIYIENITCKNGKNVQWKCSKAHKWTARIKDRTLRNSGCPYCSGNKVSDKNSLKIWCSQNRDYGKQLLDEWTGLDENNTTIDISEVSYGSSKKVQWKCKSGHAWPATIAHRTLNNRGCPHCFNKNRSEIISEASIKIGVNDLKTWCENNGKYGQRLIDEWVGLDENNKPIDISEISYGSKKKKVKWKCKECHEWLTTIKNRTLHNSGCPYCSGNKVSDKNSLKIWCLKNGQYGIQILQEWTGLDEDNNQIEIDKISYGSNKKVRWKCKSGHMWPATIVDRTLHNSGCPYCNPKSTSFPEQYIYHSLKQIYKQAISRGKYKGYEYDITIPELKLCIEYSGINWHKDKLNRDEEKKQLCKAHLVNFLQIYAHSGEIRDTEDLEVEDYYSREQIIYKVSYNKNIHTCQLQQIIKFILEQYAPEHSIAEIDFDKAELEANKALLV